MSSIGVWSSNRITQNVPQSNIIYKMFHFVGSGYNTNKVWYWIMPHTYIKVHLLIKILKGMWTLSLMSGSQSNILLVTWVHFMKCWWPCFVLFWCLVFTKLHVSSWSHYCSVSSTENQCNNVSGNRRKWGNSQEWRENSTPLPIISGNWMVVCRGWIISWPNVLKSLE